MKQKLNIMEITILPVKRLEAVNLKKKYIQNKGWTYWIFDDEPIKSFPYYGEGRNEWVEIDKSTLTEYREE